MSGALVLFMTPGLAIFYGGMVRVKSTLNMMMMSFAAMGITTSPLDALRLFISFR
jgi:Amt family ammonium transporter